MKRILLRIKGIDDADLDSIAAALWNLGAMVHGLSGYEWELEVLEEGDDRNLAGTPGGMK